MQSIPRLAEDLPLKTPLQGLGLQLLLVWEEFHLPSLSLPANLGQVYSQVGGSLSYVILRSLSH